MTTINIGVANFRRDSVQALLDDTTISYTAGAGKRVVTEGEVISAGEFTYTVAASGATDEHITTAGSVKLYVLPNNGNVYNVLAFGAVGDDLTDNEDALQLALDVASAAAGTDQRSKVLIPSGIYQCGGQLVIKSNTVVENRGHLKHTGGDAIGQFVSTRASSNIEIYGGIWDSNDQGNNNTIGISFVNANQTVAGPACENIFIHDLVIKNCKHGGSHISDPDDPADVGRGGGKGITIQFGAKGVCINNVVLEDCDLGFSIEGKEADEAYCSDVQVSNMLVKNSKYIGLFLSSVPNTVSLYGQTTSIQFNNIDLVDCGVGQTTETVPQDVAALFGAITCQGMVAAKGTNIRVRSTTGKQTVFRGSMRLSDWDVEVLTQGTLVDVVNTAPYAGHNPVNINSRWNTIKAKVIHCGATVSGYWLNSNASYPAAFSTFNFTGIWLNAGTATAFATSTYCNSWPTDCEMQFYDLHNQRRFTSNIGAPLDASVSWAKTFINGLAIDDDSANSATAIGPTRSLLLLRDLAGATQARIENGLFWVSNKLALGSSTRTLTWGAGSPEGVVTATAGAVYLNTSGGAGTTLYVKESGTGNTGWVGK